MYCTVGGAAPSISSLRPALPRDSQCRQGRHMFLDRHEPISHYLLGRADLLAFASRDNADLRLKCRRSAERVSGRHACPVQVKQRGPPRRSRRKAGL